MSEQRLVELETRFAYQDETIRVLSEALARQQREIERLQRICRELMERATQTQSLPANSAAEEVPPHY
jgi:SlyX protein